MQPSPNPHASKPRRILGHVTLLALAGAAGLLAQLALGPGFTWIPRSAIAWGVIVAAFALGEGFLHWFLRQARRVADQDVLFRGVAAAPDAERHRAADRKAVATSEHSTRR